MQSALTTRLIEQSIGASTNNSTVVRGSGDLGAHLGFGARKATISFVMAKRSSRMRRPLDKEFIVVEGATHGGWATAMNAQTYHGTGPYVNVLLNTLELCRQLGQRSVLAIVECSGSSAFPTRSHATLMGKAKRPTFQWGGFSLSLPQAFVRGSPRLAAHGESQFCVQSVGSPISRQVKRAQTFL